MGATHSHRYNRPCRTQRICESASYITCVRANKNEWIAKNSNQFEKPIRYAKCGDKPANEHRKISNRFKPLSNFNATPNGNRNKPELKSADFEEDGNMNQKTFQSKHSIEISKYSSLQHNLQDTLFQNKH